MQELLNTELWSGTSLGDLLTLEFLTAIAGGLLSAVFVLTAGFIIAGWLSRRIQGLATRHSKLDQTLFNFLSNIVWYAVVAFSVLIVLNTLGVQTTSVIAVIGAAGLAVGLALQGTLSNVAAGVMIVLFRPFKLGDFVVINGQMGTVKSISLNYTELADLQNLQIIVPNSEVWGNTIISYSANPTRRVEWTFGVSYGSNLAVAEKTIIDTIMADERAMADPEPFIQVSNLGDFSVDFTVRVWCKNDDAWGFKTDGTRKVKEALDAAGVEIPFPTRTVYPVQSDDEDDDTRHAAE
ncbi:mechanosensitive ion channel family protein [Limimaricola sp.]|uniref:mechanosensitive ion channel family protein n=1 Tax=Limimaricola sp. TaxID=2211665 RepID=UPI0040599C2A